MLFSGAWGKVIHEKIQKNLKQKFSWHCPFKWGFKLLIYTLKFIMSSPSNVASYLWANNMKYYLGQSPELNSNSYLVCHPFLADPWALGSGMVQGILREVALHS